MWVFPSRVPDGEVTYEMPMPIDRMTNFSGSGLPWPSAAVAYNPSQRGSCKYFAGHYTIDDAEPPNVYVDVDGHQGDAGDVGAPEAVLTYTSAGLSIVETVRVWGAEVVPHRNVVPHAARKGPEYYDSRNTRVRSQEEILRASGYGHAFDDAVDFGWGSRPRV